MDERLKRILDDFEAVQIGLDDRFEFRCRKCGKCCTRREDVVLNASDLYRLSKQLGITPEDLIKQYGEIYVGMDSRIPIVRLRPRGSVKRCPFLKDRKCMVHKAKPTVCAMFPLGRYLVVEDTGKAAGETVSREIRYIFNHPGCGDRSETHTVRDWLERFGIPVADEFFFMWQEIVLKMSMTFREVEDRMSEKTMEMLWTAALSVLYLNYDMDREFMPQFEENVRGLEKLLNTVFPNGK